MSFAETVAAIREQEGIVYLPHPFDRMHAIPFPATLHRHLHEIDVLEVYNARLLFEGYNDEAAPLRAQVRPAGGRRLRRPRAPGRRHGRAPHARLRRPGGVHALGSRRRGAAPAEVAGLPAEPQVGGPGQGEGALGANRETTPVAAASTDEIYERYLQKAISEINDLGHEIGRAGDETARPRVRVRAIPLADVFLLKYAPKPSEIQEGVAFFGRAGEALKKSLQRLHVDPMVRLRDELPQVRRRELRRGRAVADPELHIVQPKLLVLMGEQTVEFVNALGFPLSDPSSTPRPRGCSASRRRSRRSSSRTSTPRSTRRRRRRPSGTRSRRSASGGRIAAVLSRPPLGTRTRGPDRGARAYTAGADRLWRAGLWPDVLFLTLVLFPASSRSSAAAAARVPAGRAAGRRSRSSRSRWCCVRRPRRAHQPREAVRARLLGFWFLSFFENVIGRRWSR